METTEKAPKSIEELQKEIQKHFQIVGVKQYQHTLLDAEIKHINNLVFGLEKELNSAMKLAAEQKAAAEPTP